MTTILTNTDLDEFAGVKFRIRTDEGVLTERDLTSERLEVRVFNKEFVQKNLSFDTSEVIPIMILGEHGVEIEKEIKAIEGKLATVRQQRNGFQEALSKIPDVSRVLTDCGTAVVREFTGTSLAADRYYGRSYNKTRVQHLLDDCTVSEANLGSLVIRNPVIVETLRQQVSMRRSEVIFSKPDLGSLNDIFKQGNALLRRIVTVATINELKNDDELRAWVKEGYHLHNERDHQSCLFCSNPLPADLLARYGAFFTAEVAKTEEEITTAVTQLEHVEQLLLQRLPDSSDFFPDIACEYKQVKSQVESGVGTILAACQSLRTRLEHRRGRVSIASSQDQEVPFPDKEINEVKSGYDTISRLCAKQAERLQAGDEEVKKAARCLELHTVASLLSSKDYFKHKAARENLEKQLSELNLVIKGYETEILTKRAALRSIVLAADEINSLITEFLGPGEIALKVPPGDDQVGYLVTMRKEPTRYLSEGEKSIVALAYFLVKLREEGCNPEKTVVVLDDPVDSQDSVFLFRTYGLIKRRLDDVGQLFILTHNHEFFNLIRDWFSSPTCYEDSRLFWIEMQREDWGRRVIVRDLPRLLRDHKSEYQYLVYRLYARKEDIEKLDDPLVPNIARKILESFAAFKWSCRTSEELSSIVQNMFVRNKDRRRNGVGDTVLKFINEYSHGREFERPISAAVMEASDICKNILEFIRLSDTEHYKCLERRFKKCVEDADTRVPAIV